MWDYPRRYRGRTAGARLRAFGRGKIQGVGTSETRREFTLATGRFIREVRAAPRAWRRRFTRRDFFSPRHDVGRSQGRGWNRGDGFRLAARLFFVSARDHHPQRARPTSSRPHRLSKARAAAVDRAIGRRGPRRPPFAGKAPCRI